MTERELSELRQAGAANEVFQIIRRRQSVRSFSPEEVPLALLLELLEVADRAPSGFNLQPWHFVVVTDPKVRELLCHAAMGQPQVKQAPATVVFVSDPDSWRGRFDKVLELSRQCGALDEARIKMYRNSVHASFQMGPLGVVGFLKRVAVPILRRARPIPSPLTSTKEAGEYVCRQTIFAAQTFMLAAESVGLSTVPMEGFDEWRVRKLLHIPRSMRVPLLVTVGYRSPEAVIPRTPRLDLSEKVSLNHFENRLVHESE